MAVTKRPRNKPCKPRGVNSKGINGATRHPLTPVQKVLVGQGRYAALEPVECKAPWRGLAEPSKPAYNPQQVEVNKRLYPHLFPIKEKR